MLNSTVFSWRRRCWSAAAIICCVACSSSGTSSQTDAGNEPVAKDAGSDGGPDSGTTQACSGGAKNIVETAAAAGNFTMLAGALMQTGLDKALSNDGPFTVFAPTDAAFAALGTSALAKLSKAQLAAVLKYHVISGNLSSADLQAGPIKTLSGLTAFVNLDNGVRINDAMVTMADIKACNGVIHVIDKVLIPPNLVQAATFAGNLDQLLAAATKAGVADTLRDPNIEVTVFAPTDDAFAALPAGTVAGLTNQQLTNVLKYHVVQGKLLSSDLKSGNLNTLNGETLSINSMKGTIHVNDAKVIEPDIIATNGVIHEIDKVLMPPM
jgi:transforming growth factor-beta-induced protein